MRLPGHIPPSTSRSPSSSATHRALPRRSASFPRLLRGANYRVHVAAPNSPGSSLQEPFLVDRRSQPPPSSPTPSSNGGTQGTTQCVATGDSVMCEMLEQEEEQLLLSERTLSGSAASTAPPSLATTVMNTALLVSPFFFWGTSMPALKLVMPHVPSPLLLGALRLLPASLLLIAWAAVTGRKHPNTWQAWGWILLFSIVDGAAFQGFLAQGLTHTSAGLGSVIIDSQPLTVAVLAAVLFGEKLGPTAVVGLLTGVVGLLFVNVPPDTWEVLFEEGASALFQQAPALPDALGSWQSGLASSGEFWMLMAAQSMAVGTVMVRYVTRHADSVYATGYHMLFGGLMLLGALAAQDMDVITDAWQACTPTDAAILAYISVLGGAASYGVFFYNASIKGNLTALSSLTFLTPLFAVAGGYLVLNETLTSLQVVGAMVTLGAVALITHKAPPSE